MVTFKRYIKNYMKILNGSKKQELEMEYHYFTNAILEYGGKIHGSQSHISIFHSTEDYFYSIIIYYEIPIENIAEFERKYAKS